MPGPRKTTRTGYTERLARNLRGLRPEATTHTFGRVRLTRGLTVTLSTLLPPARVAPSVQAGYDDDRIRGHEEVDAVGETGQQGAAHVAVHEREARGHAGDLGQDGIDGLEEAGAEAG